tara:strand:- start:18187 stop:19365 length:1179 start_codon:yes stop_codon:yes gene_type:complete
MFKKIITWACLLGASVLTVTPAYATRSISFDTGYVVHPYSNRAFSSFGVELFEAHDYLFGLVKNKYFEPNGWNRGLLFGADLLILYPLSSAYTISYHEFGHYSRLEAVGHDPHFVGRPNHFFGFFLDKLVHAPFGGESTAYPALPALTNDEKIVVGGAGVNNEMRFAGDIADRAYYDYGHVMDFVPYISGKLSSASYASGDEPGNDMNFVLNAYKAQEYNVSRADINRANWLSLVLSASTYAYAFGIYDYYTEGETTVKTFEFEGWRLPDLESYINRKGVSYKLKSAYRWDETLILPFSYEVILHGKEQHEVTLGARKLWKEFHNLTTGANLIMSDGIGGNMYVNYPVLKDWAVTVGLDHYDHKSLHGERNSIATTRSTSSTEVWAKVSFLY